MGSGSGQDQEFPCRVVVVVVVVVVAVVVLFFKNHQTVIVFSEQCLF